jgi:predicted Ser/Thr protein kinase
MNIASLDTYRLMSEGGQSKIYDYADDKVLRVPKREIDYDSIRYEFRVYTFLEGKLSVPHVHEVAEYRGVPCLIMEKLMGPDLFSVLGTRPLSFTTMPGILAGLHGSLFSLKTSDAFNTNHDKARYCIGRAPNLDDALKEKLFTILDRLPSGTTLCHGDFHPGNIIESGKKHYVIDWSSASIGSPLFDIAHTYLLLMNTPRLDNVPDRVFRVQRIITGYVGKRYLKLVCAQNGIAVDDLFPYLLVKAGERCFYGMSSEQEWLHSFIERNIDGKGIRVKKIREYA